MNRRRFMVMLSALAFWRPNVKAADVSLPRIVTVSKSVGCTITTARFTGITPAMFSEMAKQEQKWNDHRQGD